LQEDAQDAATVPGKAAAVVAARGDDRYWALGMFYHNPDDPAILVEDRFGSNIGLNYSRGISKLCVALLIALLIGSYAWITWMLY
jgi:uncharacterized membrane protein